LSGPVATTQNVEDIERALPTRGNEFHRKRFERDDGSTYLLAWLDGGAVGHVLLLPESKYDEVPAALGPAMEVNGLGVAASARRRRLARAPDGRRRRACPGRWRHRARAGHGRS
jgi:hypothetical protein